MKRIGLFLFFCILSLHGIAQVENDKDTLIIRQDKINEFINEMNVPSIGEARNAGVMYTQRLNDFITVTGGVYAAKYNVYGVRFNDLGAKGKLSFRINDRMKINMFGTYSVYNGYGMTPASQLFMNQNSYGGTLEFKISDSFGIEAGAEREFNPMTRKWETHPIIMPVFY